MINTVRLDALVDEIMKEVQLYAEEGFPNETARKDLVDKISDILYDSLDELIEIDDEDEFDEVGDYNDYEYSV